MQQPDPTKLMSLTTSPSRARKSFNWSPHSGLCPWAEQVARAQLVEIARLLAMVEDDLLIEIAQFVKHLSVLVAYMRDWLLEPLPYQLVQFLPRRGIAGCAR